MVQSIFIHSRNRMEMSTKSRLPRILELKRIVIKNSSTQIWFVITHKERILCHIIMQTINSQINIYFLCYHTKINSFLQSWQRYICEQNVLRSTSAKRKSFLPIGFFSNPLWRNTDKTLGAYTLFLFR